MHLIKSNTVSNAVLRCYDTIQEEGVVKESRNGGTKTLYDVTVEVTNPRSRHLYLKERKSNIFGMMAETLWVMAGDDQLDPYLSFFLPRAKDYSDDGRAWFSAYGPRLYMFDQLQGVVDTFKEDTIDTRRAYLSIQMPHTDAPSVVKQTLKGAKPKDISCNQLVQFYVTEDNKFNTKVIQRSGDIVFGTGSINPFEFSVLHELMFNELKRTYPDMKLGSYKWHVTNMHAYDWSADQTVAAVADDNNWGISNIENHIPLVGPRLADWQDFFGDLIHAFSKGIVSDNLDIIADVMDEIEFVFDDFQVRMEDNLLWDYCELITRYIAAKKGFPDMWSPMNISSRSVEFKQSIFYSTFRKFEVIT